MNNLTFGEKLSFLFSCLWRAMVVGIISTICSGIIGFPVGYVSAASGIPMEWIPLIGACVGLPIGIYSWYLYLSWLFASRLGGYRLQLVRA